MVARSVEALKGRVRQYVFISSITVYAEFNHSGVNENAPVSKSLQPDTDEFTGETYGPLKEACENVVSDAFGDAALIIRPGLIVGPRDNTDRFTYWPARVARGGQILAPGDAERQIQFIDVRDLAQWIIALTERALSGTFNATGPSAGLTMGALLHACKDVCASRALFDWVDEEFLAARKVEEWVEMPLWIKQSDAAIRGFMSVDIQRALNAGLICRPVQDTIGATLDWSRSRPGDYAWRAGLEAAKKQAVLDAWAHRGKT